MYWIDIDPVIRFEENTNSKVYIKYNFKKEKILNHAIFYIIPEIHNIEKDTLFSKFKIILDTIKLQGRKSLKKQKYDFFEDSLHIEKKYLLNNTNLNDSNYLVFKYIFNLKGETCYLYDSRRFKIVKRRDSLFLNKINKEYNTYLKIKTNRSFYFKESDMDTEY